MISERVTPANQLVLGLNVSIKKLLKCECRFSRHMRSLGRG